MIFRISSFVLALAPYFAPISLSHRPPPQCFSPNSDMRFDWTASGWDDSTKDWAKFTSFLESKGVFLFGTEAYNRPPFPPPTPATSPFLPNHGEDFVHRQIPCTWKRKIYHDQYPFCTVALDNLGRDIYVKAVQKNSNEWRILELLTSPTLRSDPTNHTIPIVSILHHNETVFLIQAQWGMNWLLPCPKDMKERYEIAFQLTEGLAFMHRHGIGHGDIHADNIVWNCHDTRMSRRSPNFAEVRRDFDVRFAFIDFGASVRFPIGAASHHIPYPLITPPFPYRSPEYDSEVVKTIDLFAADVYGLGQILIYEASRAETGLPVNYTALLNVMTAPEPSHRPSAEEALRQLKELIKANM